MILLVSVTAISLTMLQGVINAPRDAFRECTRAAAAKARSENVGGDAFEAYMRNTCSVQIGALRSAVQAFNMKNGMGKKAAAADADLTVEDYAASPVEQYRLRAGVAASTAAAAPPAAPTATPSQPPKQ